VNILDVIEVWWGSLRMIFEALDVQSRFERSPADRLNPSCNLNMRCSDGRERDFVVWDSGEAELLAIEVDGTSTQTHFEDVRNPDVLISILSQLAGLRKG
jgi:hypothetical protein